MIHSPVEHALRLLISGAPDAALRWSAAALESDAASPAALVVTAHALWRVGQKRAAIDAFTAAARRAALASDAPLAIAAIAELRTVGVNVEKLIAEVAEIVCGESSLEPPWAESPAWRGSLQPVSPMLTRNALVSRATQLVYEAAGAEHPQSTTTTFLGALSPATFRELALALHAMIVPPGFHAVEEDRESLDSVRSGERRGRISRRGGRSGARPLATLESGLMFGEMSMLASLPAATSAITTQPAILLFASRDAFEAIGARRKDLRLELAAHCRRQAVANLGSACAFMSTVPARERGAFVDRMVSRVYARGERLVRAGEEPAGLHLILSGEVALVGHEDAERIVLFDPHRRRCRRRGGAHLRPPCGHGSDRRVPDGDALLAPRRVLRARPRLPVDPARSLLGRGSPPRGDGGGARVGGGGGDRRGGPARGGSAPARSRREAVPGAVRGRASLGADLPARQRRPGSRRFVAAPGSGAIPAPRRGNVEHRPGHDGVAPSSSPFSPPLPLLRARRRRRADR